MLRFFQTKVGAKIALGYLIMLTLILGISLLASARLKQIDTTMNNLTQRLSREKDLSAEISLRMLSVRYHAGRYISAHRQEDLDQFNDQYARLKNSIIEMNSIINDPERSQMSASIKKDVLDYGTVFSKAAELIREKQQVKSEILDVQGLGLDTRFSALRVHTILLNDSAAFLAYSTAQSSYQLLHQNVLDYWGQSDERYTVFAKKNYTDAQSALVELKASLSDEIQRANVDATSDALAMYYEGFQSIIDDETQLRQLLNTQLGMLESQINDETAQINNSVNAEFEQANLQSQKLLAQTQTSLFSATVLAIIAGTFLAVILSRSITRPLGQVQHASYQLANTDIQAFTSQMITLSKGDVRLNLQITSQPLNVDLKDEVGQTARSFNEIVTSLYKAEKAFGEMSAYLNEMAQAAQKIGHGNLNVEITPRSNDDVLGNSIRNMLEGLRAAQKQVQETHDHLEELVARRTWELMEAKEIAENATRSKSIFLANMSHELRTPLNAILGFAQLMARDTNLSHNQRDNLETIKHSGAHLLSLINDVLEMSKIEAGRITLNPTGFDLYNMLATLESMFKLRTADKGLQLNFEINPETPAAIRADEGKLRQVLINLLNNAIKFTDQGGITLRLRAKAGTPSQVTLHFEVEDTGSGIDQEDAEKLFEPFTQTTLGMSSQEGSGLGLAISRQFVNVMGGQMKVKSQVGRGSVFSFFIPVEIISADEIAEQVKTDISPRVIGLVPGQQTFRILIVEDKEPSRQLMVKLLEPIGFEVREAVNGLEAIQIWEQWHPHLIWMDMRMPVMDGHEATKRIKATERGKNTFIVALTASAFEEDRSLVLSEGCDEFVRKPFRESDIFDTMKKFLGIQYVYEEQAQKDTASHGTSNSSNQQAVRHALRSLNPGLLAQLNLAAAQADSDKILELINSMDEKDSNLAKTLAEYVHHFRFDLLMSLTQPEEGG